MRLVPDPYHDTWHDKIYRAAAIRTARTGKQYQRWDSAFHAKIAQTVRNELFRSVFEVINAARVDLKWPSAREQSWSQTLTVELLDQHEAIVPATEERDRRELRSVCARISSGQIFVCRALMIA